MKPIFLIKSGFWITYSTFLTRLFAFLSNLVLARLLLPSDFGIIGIAYIFWSFFTLFTQDTTGSFIVYKGIEDKRYLNTAYTISLGIGLTFALLLVALAPVIASFFNQPNLTWILVVFAFNLILSCFCSIYSAIMTRKMQFQDQANITLMSSITRLFCTTGAALCGLKYWSFVIGDTASWIVYCLLTYYKSGYHLRLHLDPTVRGEVLSYYLGTTGSGLGFYINANVDNFVVGKLLGNTSLGYYNLSYQLTMALSTIFNSVIGQLGMPIFSQIEDEQKQEDTLFKVVEQIAFLTAPIYALFFLVIDRQVIALVFGSNWIPMSIVIPGLLVFAYFRVINTPLNVMLSAKGRPDINARVNLYIAPIAILGFIIGARYGGIFGVSIAVAIVLGIVWTIYWWWVGCQKLGWSVTKFLIACFTPAFISLPCLAISYNLPLLLKPLTFIVLYLLCIRILAQEHFLNYKNIVILSLKWLKKKYIK